MRRFGSLGAGRVAAAATTTIVGPRYVASAESSENPEAIRAQLAAKQAELDALLAVQRAAEETAAEPSRNQRESVADVEKRAHRTMNLTAYVLAVAMMGVLAVPWYRWYSRTDTVYQADVETHPLEILERKRKAEEEAE